MLQGAAAQGGMGMLQGSWGRPRYWPSPVVPLLALVLLVTALTPGCGAAEEVVLTTGTLKFADIDVFYRMYDGLPKDTPVVMFLHGARYTSQDWVDIGTLKYVRDRGYRTIAVDLPGHGSTGQLPYVDNNMRAEMVKAAMDFSGMGSNVTESGAVLVSPSMSGKWAIPFLDRYGLMLKGWVAVAPVGVVNWGGPWEYTHKKVSLLAMYGENDPMLPQAEYLQKLFGKARKAVISDAGHACYMDNTKQFNDELGRFITANIHVPNPKLGHEEGPEQ